MDYDDKYVGLTEDEYAARIALLRDQARMLRKEMSIWQKLRRYFNRVIAWLI